MSNETKNLEELKAAALAATPGPWFRSGVQFNGITTEQSVITQGNKPHVASASEKRDAIFIAEANPAAVLALLAELEIAQQRIAELEQKLALVREQRDNELRTNAELEKRLATPVRLPQLCGDGDNDTEYTEGLNDGITQSAIHLRRQGFKVEGDA